MSTSRPKALQGNDTGLTIVWADEVSHEIPWSVLRQVCPCATCRTKDQSPPEPADEFDLPVISPAEARPLKATAMRPVGNYAYAINFTDGHNTGIYPLDLLRRVGEEVDEARRAAE